MLVAPFISAISLALLAFLTVILLVDNKRPKGTMYLVALLLMLGVVITIRLSFDLASPLLIYLPFVVFPAGFLYAPFIYLYAMAALFGRSPSRRFWGGVWAMACAVFTLHTVLYIRFEEMRDLNAIMRQSGIIAYYTHALVIASSAYSLGFLWVALRNLRRYEIAYQENFAGNDRDQLIWLKTLLYFNLALALSFAGAVSVAALLNWKIPGTPFEGGLALIMIYVILYYFIRKPAIFTLPATAIVEPPQQSAEKYKKQNLSDTERRAYMQKIEEYVGAEKPFLDDKVTLAALAREIGIPAHHFSMVINIERNTNFYHFINAYRVEEAKALLKDPSMADETVLDIALMAGFQSKAGFNKVFKDITGLTPTAFREQQAAGTQSAITNNGGR